LVLVDRWSIVQAVPNICRTWPDNGAMDDSGLDEVHQRYARVVGSSRHDYTLGAIRVSILDTDYILNRVSAEVLGTSVRGNGGFSGLR
jgi:hypothetical protein